MSDGRQMREQMAEDLNVWVVTCEGKTPRYMPVCRGGVVDVERGLINDYPVKLEVRHGAAVATLTLSLSEAKSLCECLDGILEGKLTAALVRVGP